MHCSGILFMSYSVGLFFLSLQRTLLLKAFRPQIYLYHYSFTSYQNPTFMRCKLTDILFSKALKFPKAAVLKQIQLFASALQPWLTARSPRSTALDLSDSSLSSRRSQPTWCCCCCCCCHAVFDGECASSDTLSMSTFHRHYVLQLQFASGVVLLRHL